MPGASARGFVACSPGQRRKMRKPFGDLPLVVRTRGGNAVVADAGHAIHLEKHEAAVRAVQAALDMLP